MEPPSKGPGSRHSRQKWLIPPTRQKNELILDTAIPPIEGAFPPEGKKPLSCIPKKFVILHPV